MNRVDIVEQFAGGMREEKRFLLSCNEKGEWIKSSEHLSESTCTRLRYYDEYKESTIESAFLEMLTTCDYERGEISVGDWKTDVVIKDSITIESKKRGSEKWCCGITQTLGQSENSKESYLCSYNVPERYVKILEKCDLGLIDLHPQRDLIRISPEDSMLKDMIDDNYIIDG